MKAQVRWNADRGKYELVAKGKVLVTSVNSGYLTYLVAQQKHTKILKAGVTAVEITSHAPVAGVEITTPDGSKVGGKQSPYTIEQRFSFMEQMIHMVINKTALSMFICGEGGIGKTYSVLDCLNRAGKIDYYKTIPNISTLEILPSDDAEEMRQKALSQMQQSQGDYVVIKGHTSAAALYRTLFEHRRRLIVFDDCDSVFRDGASLGLLKPALDSYEERWVAWRVERQGDSDLPTAFKFEGSVIFVSNMPLAKIDQAIKTRCLKVDVSMTKQQCIERMRGVLSNVMPEIKDLRVKEEALKLLEEHQHLTDDVNFRSLMSIISIRADPTVPDWRELARFALTEQ